MDCMEIEVKAHVKDRDSLLQKVKAFSSFDKIVIKDDSYFKLAKEGFAGGHLTARLRREERRDKENKLLESANLLTYKKKERRLSADGAAIEVNQEYESAVENPQALEALFLDIGFEPYFTKHKDTIGFYADTPCGKAHLELCSVPPLGDFLEIEFVTDGDSSAEEIEAMRKELEALVLKSGLRLEDIEEKYYSELLQEIKGDKK